MMSGRLRGPRDRGGVADAAAVWLANRCGWQISESERRRQVEVVERMHREGLHGLTPDANYQFRGKDWPMWLYIAEGLFWRWLEWPGSVLAKAEGRLRRWWQGD